VSGDTLDWEVELGRELVSDLRRPFAASAIRFKIQSNPRQNAKGEWGKALVVSYIDARTASERLNAVCGLGWSEVFTPVDGGLECSIRVGATVHTDVGWSRSRGSDIDLKALYSDAFKRCAVKYGVGVSLYALPQQWVAGGELDHRGQNFYLPAKVVAQLRERYEKWLKDEGIAFFGEVLDHGNGPEAQGDVEAEQAPAPEPEAEPSEVAAEPANLTRLRAKARYMADALAAKSDTDPLDMRTLIDDAQDEAALAVLFKRFCADLKGLGGDPEKVADNFELAHAA